MIKETTVYDYKDGCSIEFCPDDGEVTIEYNNDYCVSNNQKESASDDTTGETVIEYSGLASKDEDPKRSWAIASFSPNASSPLHYHKVGTEDYYIIKGNAIVIVDGNKKFLSPGDHLQILPGHEHQVFNPSNEDELLIIVRCKPSWTLKDYYIVKFDIELKQTHGNSYPLSICNK